MDFACNGVCILSKDEYLSKLDTLINDETKFKMVPKSTRKNARHQIFRRQEVIKSTIKEHFSKTSSEGLIKTLLPSGKGTGKLYGLCKVHETDFLLRPIVSMVNTPEYALAKHLDTLIKPHIPDEFSTSSNVEFLQRLRDFNVKE